MAEDISELRAKRRIELEEVGWHALILIATLLSIWVIQHALDLLLGKDAAFFDIIPIRYVIDAGHLAAFLKFVYSAIRSFKDA